MKDLKAFGHDWVIRSDTEFSPYSDKNVSHYRQAIPVLKEATSAQATEISKPLLLVPTTERVSLRAPEGGAACIMTKAPLGYGTYETILIGRMDAFDPSIVTAVWTHHDLKPDISVEIDFEYSPWRDQNRSKDRMQLGVFVGGQRDSRYTQKLYGATSYYYHKITLQQFRKFSRVTVAGWWEMNQSWRDWAYAEWPVETPEMGQFKIGIGPMSTNAEYVLPRAASLPAKVVVAGFQYTPG